MPALPAYFARASLERLQSTLPQPVSAACRALTELLDDAGYATVQRALEKLFPLAATPASANASLNRLMHEFNAAAEKAGHPVRLAITKAKNVGASRRQLWFDGPAETGAIQRTPDLAAVPQSRLQELRAVPLDDDAAEVVLLTFNEHETAAVLRAFCGDQVPPLVRRGELDYHVLGTHGGMRVVHGVSSQGSMTLGGALQSAGKAIAAWRPRAVIPVGIAFGVEEGKQHIGDVLVSTHIQNYELNRVNANGTLTPRGSKPDASPALLNRLHTLDRTRKAEQSPHWPVLRFGIVLSGESLIDNLDYRDSLRQHCPEAIGGEMEGNGIYAAAQDARCDWAIVKGICDWADGNKSRDKTRNQKLAAANAAKVVHAMLGCAALYPDAQRQGSCPTPETATPEPDVPHAAPSARHMGLRDLIDLPAGQLDAEARAQLTTLHKDREDEFEARSAASVNVLEYLLDWARDPAAPGLFALLGQYGMGKTITCQRLVQEMDAKRCADPGWPLPLYFDLRNLTGLKDRVPTWQETVDECMRRGWTTADGAAGGEAAFMRLMERGAVIIFDGLDEALVKLTEADGQAFTANLLKLSADAKSRGHAVKLLVSCRTQYFRSLRDQRTHFTGQERGEHGADEFRAVLLLPFGEEQVRRYLAASMPEADIDRLMELVRSVHNLHDLASRPYTLKLVSEFIPQIEREYAAGRKVRGVSLYRMVANRWLDRDKGKHHIKPEHKLRLAAHLAAELWRKGGRLLPVSELESWFHQWLQSQPDLAPRYQRLHPDQLEEDLRTATFLARVDGAVHEDGVTPFSGFRFSHTSLLEFFLASYLFAAAEKDAPQCWDMPPPSGETLDFLGQMMDEAPSPLPMSRLQEWRRRYRPRISENLLAYAMRANGKGWPAPSLRGTDLRGANLRGLAFGDAQEGEPPPASRRFDLSDARLAEADLRETRFDQVVLDGADFSGANLQSATLMDCSARRATWRGARLDGAWLQRVDLEGGAWGGGSAWRVRLIDCPGSPAQASAWPDGLRASSSAPANGPRPDRRRLELLGTHSPLALTCEWSPDGRRLATAGMDHTLTIWDTASGECLRVIKGHHGMVYWCAWSPDGRRIASSAGDDTVRIWDAFTGECLHALAGTGSCAWSPDGRRLACAENDGALHIWNTANGERIQTLRGHNGRLTCCAWTSDGRRLASASLDKTVRLWNVSNGRCVRVLREHDDHVLSVAWSPDGSRLVSGDAGGAVRFWDGTRGECLKEVDARTTTVYHCAWSPDGTRVLCVRYAGALQILDAADGECLRSIPATMVPSKSAAWSPDGTRIAGATLLSELLLWDAGSGEQLRAFHTGARQSRVTCDWSRDGDRLLSSWGNGVLQTWDAHSGEHLQTFTGRDHTVSSCAWSPDGLRAASASLDGTLCTWDTDTGRCLQVFKGHTGPVVHCAWSPDGRWLLSAGENGTVRIWNASDGTCLRAQEGPPNLSQPGAWSPDSRHFLIAHEGALHLWDLFGSGQHSTRKFTGGYGTGAIQGCAWSPDGQHIAAMTDDHAIHVWRASATTPMHTLTGHIGSVGSCAWSPDGRQLLSAATDGTLRLWRLADAACVCVFEGHAGTVGTCAWTPGGDRIVSAGYDGTLRVWDAATGECLRVHFNYLGDRWRRGAGHAVWWTKTQQIVEATGEVGRTLQWLVPDGDGGFSPVPLESFGALPRPRRAPPPSQR